MIDSAEIGLQASVEGFANEHIVVGILMKKYQNVSLVNLPLSPYDIIIVFKDTDGKENIIRAQVKTATRGVSFIGGSRGGVDRVYLSGVKTYTQSTKTSDIVIGLHALSKDAFELYFVPTILIEHLKQKSISLNKIAALKNNYEILEQCKNQDYVINKCKEYRIIPGFVIVTPMPIKKDK
ncbi:MAG: hypothetical protein ACE14V_12425 [bacterium]